MPKKKPTITIGKLPNGRFTIAFATDDGKVIAELSIPKHPAPTDPRSDDEKTQLMLGKLKRLARAFDAAVK
jgi:hypothetical protein